jgi:citrate lyase subunit beta / citryl-CoA lyase
MDAIGRRRVRYVCLPPSRRETRLMPNDIALRSWLFAPGSSEHLLSKVASAGSDAVIIDLEDAVAPDMKARARQLVADWLAVMARTEPIAPRPERWVRVNQSDGIVDPADLEAIVLPGLSGIMVPKVEVAETLERLDHALARHERDRGLLVGSIELVALIESAVGVRDAAAIAAVGGRLRTLAFGAVDYSADFGIAARADSPVVEYAIAHLAVVARAAGLAPLIDTVFLDLDDDEGLARATERGYATGCFGKLIIHPRQLPTVHRLLTPGPEAIAQARRVVEAFEAATADGRAAIALDGRFIDLPVVTAARRVLALADGFIAQAEN